MTEIRSGRLSEICQQAAEQAGADPATARILADATVEAELVGNRAVGVGHLFDYLDGFRSGRIAAGAKPLVDRTAPAVVAVDAASGLAQTAFAEARKELLEAARESGLAALWIHDSFTCGELGYYARQLARDGMVALAAANSPALMSLGGSARPVLGTNPLAFGIPRPGGLPIVIDQASSSTAYVNIKRAADQNQAIPDGWAVGPNGQKTEDASEALLGCLLPFGGHRGGNVALLMEVLATLSGANFSMDAAPFDHGPDSPGIGVFILAIDPSRFTGSIERLEHQFTRLRDEHQVRLPAVELTVLPDAVEIDAGMLRQLQEAAGTDEAPEGQTANI